MWERPEPKPGTSFATPFWCVLKHAFNLSSVFHVLQDVLLIRSLEACEYVSIKQRKQLAYFFITSSGVNLCVRGVKSLLRHEWVKQTPFA